MEKLTSAELAEKIVAILEDHKAKDIENLNICEKTSLADRFVICSASSATQVKALADHVVYDLEEEGIVPKSSEGFESMRWICLDYVDVVVHIFHEEERQFYALSKLWKNKPSEESQRLSEEQRPEAES
ncbi:MAG: ribosome silencing factor [Eubacteriales bacterium]|nr:ribosome silencing factor [Eubacteriales bacterium]